MSEVHATQQPLSEETAALRAALSSARRQVADEKRRADTALNQLRDETATRVSAQESAVDNAIAAVDTEAQQLAARWSALQQEGNFDEASKVMRQMSAAEAKAERYRGQKEWLAGQRQVAAASPPTSSADEQYSGAERDWIARNPRYAEDPAFKRKVDAAAMDAIEFAGVARDTPAFFEAIERKVYPERFAAGAQAAVERPAAEAGEDDALSGANEEIDQAEAAPVRLSHTREAHTVPPVTDAPVMRLESDPEQTDDRPPPRQRAVGRGGEGIRAVAAPPSRRIIAASTRAAAGGRIEPTMEELMTARALAQSIEPELLSRPNADEEIVRWYYALYKSPSAQRKQQKWYGSAA